MLPFKGSLSTVENLRKLCIAVQSYFKISQIEVAAFCTRLDCWRAFSACHIIQQSSELMLKQEALLFGSIYQSL